METVALISGGKDSIFSIIHSQANGYIVVALANLHPPAREALRDDLDLSREDENDDMNSFMYQTVGHNVLQHYSAILGIPLYRAAITGSSQNQDLSYHHRHPKGSESDETEDLFGLLQRVKLKHPN